MMFQKYNPYSIPKELLKTRQNTQQQRLKIKKFWAKLQLGDLSFLNIVEYGIALFGQTKAGKTTLAHYLVKNSLISKFNSRSGAVGYEIEGNSTKVKLNEAVIGLGSQSQTDIPNQCETQIRFKDKKVHLFDCPGYSDSNGTLMIVANGYYHYRIFSKVKNLKFVLTFDGDNFETGKSFDKAINTIREFFNSFRNISQIKKQIFAATSFLFTKIQNQNVQKLLQILKNAKLQQTLTLSALIAQLIDEILKNKRLFIFKRPDKAQQKPSTNSILNDVHAATHFWQRQVNDSLKLVDMSQIKISVASKITADQGSLQQFQLLSSQFQIRFKQVMGNVKGQNLNQNEPSFKNIIRKFLHNSLNSKPQQKSFYTDLLKAFVKKFYIFDLFKQDPDYGKQEFQQKRANIKKQLLSSPLLQIEKYQSKWIQKLQISQLICHFLHRNQSSQGFSREAAFFQQFSDQLMKILAQFKVIRFYENNTYEKEQYANYISNFCYIIYRLLEQAKTFMIIFGKEQKQKRQQKGQQKEKQKLQRGIANVSPIIFATITGICDQNPCFKQGVKVKQAYEMAKINYICNFQVSKSQTLFYYRQFLKYCKGMIDKKPQLESKMMQLREIMLKVQKKQLAYNELINLSIKNIKNLINQLQQSHSSVNSQKYIAKMNDLGAFLSSQRSEEMIGLEMKKKSFLYAIKIYKCVNNAHRIIATYKNLIQLYNEDNQEPKKLAQLKQILIECSQYALAHGRKQLGLEMLEQAYHLIDRIPISQTYTYQKRIEERQTLGEKIGFIGLQKSYNPGQNYYDSLIMGNFCAIVQKKLLQQLQQYYQEPNS